VVAVSLYSHRAPYGSRFPPSMATCQRISFLILKQYP